MWSEGPRDSMMNPEGNGLVQLVAESLEAISIPEREDQSQLTVFWDRTCLNECALRDGTLALRLL